MTVLQSLMVKSRRFATTLKLRRFFIAVFASATVLASPLGLASSHHTDEHCFDGIGHIFKDCLDPTWQHIQSKNTHTHWQIITLDNAHNQVLDIEFKGNTHQQLTIAAGPNSNPNTPHSWLDLTAFKSGQLRFDIRVLNFASNINGFELSLGCGNNCASHPLDINPTQVGQWQHISVDVAQLIQRGLEITQVHTGFTIQPVQGEQQGVHIQLDNIRLEANLPAPMDLVAL